MIRDHIPRAWREGRARSWRGTGGLASHTTTTSDDHNDTRQLVLLFAARGGARREGAGDAREAAALGLRLLGRDAGLRTRLGQPVPFPPLGLRCDAGRHVRGDGRESLRRLAPPAQRADVRARGGAGKGAAGVVASPRRVRGVAGRARRGGRRVGRAASGDAHVRVLPAVEAVPARAGGQIGASGRRRECVAGTRTDNRDGA
mmetsp:Transcript_2960/g.10222  ORF Transcript_2960/g.10222 Transcript_2960/m.10222 type:complete len:202 (+) Transcript_2960:776-1381(+)